VNVAALVEYDGTRFAGFQRQSPEKGPTVQGELEAVLRRIAGEAIRVEAAGRTDAGVHASGQVINFHSGPRRLDAATWQRALNALLPPDIAVRAACAVADEFRARRSALARSYRYRILCAPVRAPLRERYVWRVPRRLDVAAMRAAAELLLGEHDFGAFGSSPYDRPRDGYRGQTVRTMLRVGCAWSATASDEVVCDFTANAFLSGMVRRLVGTLVRVGEGQLTPEGFGAILAARDKAQAGMAAPPQGLCLVGVAYAPGTVEWPDGEEDRAERVMLERADESEDVQCQAR
jgi:tRNA pseudouridine38-40 synthase